MSRIGKLPIIVPKEVSINFTKSILKIQGKFGNLQLKLPPTIEIIENENLLLIKLKKTAKNVKAFHGLYRTLINNMIIGVSKQFQVILLLKGVGYRANIDENKIILNVGYSHPVIIAIPDQISVEITQNITITLKSCDKQLLGLFASTLRSWRPPEPYKGKGIRYSNEYILRKAGKSGK